MKISFAITTHNETTPLVELVNSVKKYKDKEDEIVILDDFSTNAITKQVLKENENVFYRKFCGDYSKHKNYISSKCKGDYIFQIDGDETLSEKLIKNIKNIILNNKADLFWIPRINIVNGIERHHLKKWKWSMDTQNRINYPDFQGRIYKNNNNIKWTRAVHEVISGHTSQTQIPPNTELDIIHIKDIKSQIDSNFRYDTNYNSDGTQK